jgi:UDPglucose 6-dehydrogenase
VVSNPEFLREGSGLIDFFAPSQIIVGSNSERAKALLREIYQPLLAGKTIVDVPWIDSNREIPYVETDAVSAQLTKYAADAYLATRISFINEIEGLSEKIGGDIVEGLGLDPRIGPGYLQPEIGFGGPCLDKDLRALITVTIYDLANINCPAEIDENILIQLEGISFTPVIENRNSICIATIHWEHK